jgi:membrane dipeptidase
MTLTHNGHNAFADSSNPRTDLGDKPEEHGGLSDLGRAAVAEMNRLGMVVDIAHVSKKTMLQAAGASRTPVVSTHSCIRALCDNARNLDDEQLDALRDVGGVVQITAVSHFLRAGKKPSGGGFSGWHDAGESPNLTMELQRRGYSDSDIAALWGGNFMRVLRQAEAAAE